MCQSEFHQSFVCLCSTDLYPVLCQGRHCLEIIEIKDANHQRQLLFVDFETGYAFKEESLPTCDELINQRCQDRATLEEAKRGKAKLVSALEKVGFEYHPRGAQTAIRTPGNGVNGVSETDGVIKFAFSANRPHLAVRRANRGKKVNGPVSYYAYVNRVTK
ncbi:hypothetical protein MBANPS3_000289 [Mucor bainieri]